MSVEEFLASRPFQPDPFQVAAVGAVARGDNVVVAAPTGAGKTLVAEAAIHMSLARGRRTFYTTPIKALSNQKYFDLGEQFGRDRVGLLTGDNVVNGDAPVVVMTTEVLRNMIYAGDRDLSGVGHVILDEVHYLQDRYRGAVWEEVIIHAPGTMRLVCLSATIANAQEFAAWIEERRGATELVVSDERPVPLENLYLIRDRYGADALPVYPMFKTSGSARRPNPAVERLLGMERGRGRRFSTPRRVEVVERLRDEHMLPAIFFIFSRAGCDSAVWSVVEATRGLVDAGQRQTIREVAEDLTGHLSDRDLAALGYGRWVDALQAGVAAHHAGLVPAFKETVEELFVRGLLSVVFATETLALGINMPARTVVLESLSKFNGETHQLLEPGDYTQLTGRAGRRGIDTIGYAVALHSRYVRFDQVTRIASAGSHPLRSSFRPSYNMAANLIARYDRDQAEKLIAASFAAFQEAGGERSVERRIAEIEATLETEERKARCERGSVAEYLELLEREADSREPALVGRLRPGDVIDVPGGSRAGRFVVLRRLARGERGIRVLALSTSGRTAALGSRELVPDTEKIGTIDMPGGFRSKDRRFRQQLLKRLRRVPESRSPARPSPSPAHPVAECPDLREHLLHARRARTTRRRLEQVRRAQRLDQGDLQRRFADIRDLLESWDYTAGWTLTSRGDRLRFVYNEMDLLLVEAVERGILWGLDAIDLVALLSTFVYEPRSDQGGPPAWWSSDLADRWERLMGLWAELAEEERRRGLDVTRQPEPGMAGRVRRWAAGGDLEDLTMDPSAAVGDFVRVMRQLVDLLRQVRDVFDELGDDAGRAVELVDRGVVAAQGVGG